MIHEKTYRLAGVAGWPVAHSRSPLLHNHWLKKHHLPGAYVYLPIAPSKLEVALRGLPALGFAGCNVTIPHKIEAMKLVDHVDPVARRIGAINTIVVEPDGSLAAHNTDVFGFLQCLQEGRPEWRAGGGPAVVVGSGGGTRAVVVALADAGVPEIRVVNRTDDRARALADEFAGPVRAHAWRERHDVLAGATLMVNTTSQGMKGQPPLDVDLSALPRDAVVCDIVYTPLETPLLAAANARGHPTVGGLGMLLHQARPGFEWWFGMRPEVTAELRSMIEATI